MKWSVLWGRERVGYGEESEWKRRRDTTRRPEKMRNPNPRSRVILQLSGSVLSLSLSLSLSLFSILGRFIYESHTDIYALHAYIYIYISMSIPRYVKPQRQNLAARRGGATGRASSPSEILPQSYSRAPRGKDELGHHDARTKSRARQH